MRALLWPICLYGYAICNKTNKPYKLASDLENFPNFE